MPITPPKLRTHALYGQKSHQPDPTKLTTCAKGKIYEQLVSSKYKAQGWAILAQNYRQIGCEIDLICQKGDTVAFVEVKYRERLPEQITDLLPEKKIQALTRGARKYLEKQIPTKDTILRFDLVLITKEGRNYAYFPDVGASWNINTQST